MASKNVIFKNKDGDQLFPATTAEQVHFSGDMNIEQYINSEVAEQIGPFVGSPLVASTAADMTDQDKIYVYVGSETGYTSGNWYYYDGTAWTSGGVYNSQALETDTTLSVSGMAADAKITGDNITQINNVIFEISIFDWSTIGSSSYPNGFRTGYYDSSDGSAKSSSHYIRTIGKVNFDGYERVTVQAPTGMSFGIFEYDGSNFVKTLCLYGAYTDPSNGTQYYSFTPVNGHLYNFTLSGWSSIANTDITETLVSGWVVKLYKSVISNIESDIAEIQYDLRKCYIKYESGSFASGKASERLSVYIPVTSGYILYRLYHFIDTSNNSNGWQIYHVYHVDNDFISNQVDLTITGEWECAIHLDGRSDFSGGHTHGDEMMNTVTFIVDGVPVAVETLTSLTACNAFRIIQNSILYDPNDSVTQIAVHGKDYLYTVNGLLLGQSLKWLVSEPLTNCFLAMFLPSKNTIDRATVNSDYEILNLPSDTAETLTTIVKSNADNVIMWDTSSGFFADIRVLEYPTGLTGGDRITISDNNGGDYNKVYFKICGGGNSAIGETWKSLTEYKLDYK